MTRSNRGSLARALMTCCGAAAVTLAMGCPVIAPPSGSPAAFDAAKFAGVYSGTWENMVIGESGNARIEIMVDEDARIATLIIDFDGNYLGQTDPPAHEVSGGYDDNGAHMQGQDDLFGTYDVVVAADGAMVGVFRNVAGGQVPLLTYTGTLTEDAIIADYEVVLPDGMVLSASTTLAKE